MINNYKNILWDFDGVLIDSMPVRDFGFRQIFKSFPEEKVNELIIYHRENGGTSRFIKIRYFFEVILGGSITNENVMNYAERFSGIMQELLTDKSLLISDSIKYVQDNFRYYNFHIVSASAENELRFLADSLDIAGYFQSVNGSPTSKTENVRKLIRDNSYISSETCLVGDSVNDFEAALDSGISFWGYNSPELKSMPNINYINSFIQS